MKIFNSTRAFLKWRRSLGKDEPPPAKIGFVPTMGALHEGHASLLREARKENDLVILSIFINPTQFNLPSDYQTYPKTYEQDLMLAKACGVNVILAPHEMSELYPDGYRYQVHETELSKILCGAHRPGHFDGVLTIVMKLLNLTRAQRVYLGEKDFQQLSLIRGLIDAFFLDVELVACPTVRETSGLALSSRNLRLTPEELELAPKLHETISSVESLDEAKTRLSQLGFNVEYLEDREDFNSDRRYVAAKLGKVRLIDNVEIKT